MKGKTDALDLKILAQVDGLEDVRLSVEQAIDALTRVRTSLANVTITMDVE